MVCEYCKGNEVIKAGVRRTKERGIIQRYYCKNCKRHFCHNDGFKHRHKSTETILATISLFAKGLSIRQIADELLLSKNTVWIWTIAYARLIVHYWRKIRPAITQTLHLDELYLHMKNTFFYIWDSICKDTRFCRLGRLR